MSKLIRGSAMSWKTTVAGIIQWLIVVLPQAGYLFDSADLSTNPDWNIVVASTAVMLGLLGARDGDVSSEKAGAK